MATNDNERGGETRGEWNKRYDALRHTCGYTGANAKRFDHNCPKCVMRYQGPPERIEPRSEPNHPPTSRKPSLDETERRQR